MQVSPVPFGATTGYALRSDADKARILREMRDSFGIVVPEERGRTTRYRGSDHARDLRHSGGRYVAMLRPRGTPYHLYLTRIGGAGVAAFIERRVSDGHFYPRIVLVRLSFAERVFDGTVVDGDMVVVKSGSHVFLASDLRAYCGSAITAITSMQALGELVSRRMHSPEPATDVCFVRACPFFAVSRLGDAVRQNLINGGLDYAASSVLFKDIGGGGDIVFALPSSFQRSARHASAPTSSPSPSPASAPAPVEEAEEEEKGEEEEEATTTDDDDDDDQGGSGQTSRRRAAFYVRRTELPDVYELYGEAAQAKSAAGLPGAMIAGVPSLRASAALRAARPDVPFEFEFNERFQRWVPFF